MNNTDADHGLRQRFLLAAPWSTYDDQIRGQGWTVVNAPRPLSGCVAWRGEFRAGIFYAAGPLEEFGRSWRATDATVLVEVTPQQVIDQVRAYFTENGHDADLAARTDPDMISTAAADDLRLPWDDAWLSLFGERS